MWDFETIGKGTGETVEFGDLSWLVLDSTPDASRKLLLSSRQFSWSWLPDNPSDQGCSDEGFIWEISPAREYLNGKFLEEHSSDDERAQICAVNLENKGNPFLDSYRGKPTTDKVFMLSLEEAVRYFAASTGAEKLAIVEGQLFYTRTPMYRHYEASPILFNLEETWGMDAEDYDEMDEGTRHDKEIAEAFPDISGLAMYALNAWVDVSEDEIYVRPALWVEMKPAQ